MTQPISPEFFDLEIYAIYRAIWEHWGKDAWKVVWRAGEVLFAELKRTMDFSEATPLTAMQQLATYLRQVGYVEDIKVREISPDELEYEMLAPVILPGAGRLIGEGGVPAHISTALMFAALKELFGLRAEMIGDPEFHDDGRAIERWRLLPAW